MGVICRGVLLRGDLIRTVTLLLVPPAFSLLVFVLVVTRDLGSLDFLDLLFRSSLSLESSSLDTCDVVSRTLEEEDVLLRSVCLLVRMNVPADPTQPILLIFLASCCSTQQILKTVSALLVYSVRCTIRFWDCTDLPPKSKQKVLSEEVTTTQNELPPDFEGELSLFANWTPVTLAAVKALDKRFEETAKQAKKIDK